MYKSNKDKTTSKVIIYSNHQLNQIKEYKLESRCYGANCRFKSDKISKHDILTVLEKFNFRCMYCDDSLHSKSWHLDHFYSKASGGRNVVENLAPSCKWCNMMKGGLDGYGFLHKCKTICENNFFKKTLDNDVYHEAPNSPKRLKKIENRKNKLNE